MPPSAGRHPPESPVPAPRATNGMLSRFASLTIAETCWADVGKTMKSASARNKVRPSDSYTISSSGSERTAPRPTMDSSSRRSSSFLESVRVDMGLSELYLTRQHLRHPGDGGGVDPVVPVEIGPRARLPEVVHAERQLGHAERRSDERERVRMAVEHGDDGHAFLLGAHEILHIRTRFPEAPIEPVGARDHEHAREDAPFAERAAGLDRFRNGDPRGEDAHRVRVGIPAGL